MSLTPAKELWKWEKISNMQWDETASTTCILDKLTSSYGQELTFNVQAYQESFLTKGQKLFQRGKSGIWISFTWKSDVSDRNCCLNHYMIEMLKWYDGLNLSGWQMPTKTALSPAIFKWTEGKHNERVMGQEMDRKTSLTNYCHEQNRLDLGKINCIYYQSNQSRILRNKQILKTSVPNPPFSSCLTLFLNSLHDYSQQGREVRK